MKEYNKNKSHKNNNNLYLKHHRQLSYHLNYKSYLNNNRENKSQKNLINIIEN